MKINITCSRLSGLLALSSFVATAALLLSSCVTLPTVNSSLLLVRVAPPLDPSDIAQGEQITDRFAHQYGYVPRSGTASQGRAGDAMVKAFGYSGTLYYLRSYELSQSESGRNDELVPYGIELAKGTGGELFFDLPLRTDDYSNNPVVQNLLKTIVSHYGSNRVRVAKPSTVQWISIGD